MSAVEKIRRGTGRVGGGGGGTVAPGLNKWVSRAKGAETKAARCELSGVASYAWLVFDERAHTLQHCAVVYHMCVV